MTKEQVIELMKSSKTEQEWNDNCDTVKKKCGGYPPYWYAEIVAGGVMATTAAMFE